MANRIWLAHEDETIRTERAKTPPTAVPVIAAMLNRPVPATYLRARKLDTRVQTRQVWTADEEARFTELMTSATPPTDKELAKIFNRTVTSIRWKIQDLGFVGARPIGMPASYKAVVKEEARQRAMARAELSSEAKARTRADAARLAAEKAAQKAAQKARLADAKAEARAKAAAARAAKPRPDPVARAVQAAVAGLLTKAMFASNALSGAAAKERAKAKSEQERILAEVNKRLARDAAARLREAKAAALANARAAVKAKQAEAARLAREAARAAREKAKADARAAAEAARAERKAAKALETATAVKKVKATKPPRPKVAVPTRAVAADEARPVSHAAPQRAMATPVVTFDPKALVVSPALAPGDVKTSGRGGWIVSRNKRQPIPPKVKATRNDALALAAAAQDAVAAFIAARGVTRAVDDEATSIVNRLRARGYIIVPARKGWMIDHRHDIAGLKALKAFAAARGVLDREAA